MSVLSQSLLTLVRRHLVPLMLLSVWHNFRYLQLVLFCVIILFRTAKVQLFSERQKVLCHFVEKKLAFGVFHAEKAVLLHHDFIIWHAIRAMVRVFWPRPSLAKDERPIPHHAIGVHPAANTDCTRHELLPALCREVSYG